MAYREIVTDAIFLRNSSTDSPVESRTGGVGGDWWLLKQEMMDLVELPALGGDGEVEGCTE